MNTPLDLPSPLTSTLPSAFCTICDGIGAPFQPDRKP
jgi:hypothetical protein